MGKRTRRTKQGQRLLADYALQEGGKACEAGLKRKAENFDFLLNTLKQLPLRIVVDIYDVREIFDCSMNRVGSSALFAREVGDNRR